LGMVTKQLDLVILGYYRNPTEVGYCKLARSLSSVVGHLVGPLQSVVYPQLSRLVGSGERSALRGKVQRLAMKVGMPLAVVVLMATCLAPLVLPTLVGPAYLPAVAATQILLVGSAVWMGFFWLRPLYLARGQVKAWTVINLVVAFLSLIAFWIVVPRWGYLGLALCLTGMAILKHSFAIAWIRRCGD